MEALMPLTRRTSPWAGEVALAASARPDLEDSSRRERLYGQSCVPFMSQGHMQIGNQFMHAIYDACLKRVRCTLRQVSSGPHDGHDLVWATDVRDWMTDRRSERIDD